MTDLAKMVESILTAQYRVREVVCPLCRGSGDSPLIYIDVNGYEQSERCVYCVGTGRILTDSENV